MEFILKKWLIHHGCRQVQNLQAGQQTRTQGRANAAVLSPQAEFPLSQGDQFFLVRPSANWMKPDHIIEGNLLYSKSADLNVKLNKKRFHRIISSCV